MLNLYIRLFIFIFLTDGIRHEFSMIGSLGSCITSPTHNNSQPFKIQLFDSVDSVGLRTTLVTDYAVHENMHTINKSSSVWVLSYQMVLDFVGVRKDP